MQLRMIALALLCSWGAMASGRDAASDSTTGESYTAEIEALASPSYQRRELARERLRAGGEDSRSALLTGLQSTDLEVRLACRGILESLAETYLERQIAVLLDDSRDRQKVDLPGWREFREAVGDSPADRRLFARIAREHPGSLSWLASFQTANDSAASDELLAELNTHLPIDVSAISQGDPVDWGLLLLAASQPQLRSVPVLSSRLRSGLLNPLVAERLLGSQYEQSLRELIEHWLEVSSDRYINESMLKISLAYECGDIARQLALRTLQSSQATPASVVAAMTLLARLEPEIARRELPRAVGDTRVWHIVATRRGPIRSQVGDVAWALLLYLENYDPRQVGFDALEADPETIYRDYSLGFDDDQHRRRAHEQAQRLLHLQLGSVRKLGEHWIPEP